MSSLLHNAYGVNDEGINGNGTNGDGINGNGSNGHGINGNGIDGHGMSGTSRSSSASRSGRGEIRGERRGDHEWLGSMVRATVRRQVRQNMIDVEGPAGPSNTPLGQSAAEDEAPQSSASSPARPSDARRVPTRELVSEMREDLLLIEARNDRNNGIVLASLRRLEQAVFHIARKQDSMAMMQMRSLTARVRAGASSGPQPQTFDVNEDEDLDKARQDSAATATSEDVPNTQTPNSRGVPVVPRRQGATFIIGPDHSDVTDVDTPEVTAVYIPERSISRRPLDQRQPDGEPREDSPTLAAPSASYAEPSSTSARAPEASSSRTAPSIVVEPAPSTSHITTPRSWKGKGRVNEPGPWGTSNSASTSTSTSDDDGRHLVHEQPSPGTQAPSHPPATPGYVDPETGIDTGMSEEEYRAYLAEIDSGDSEEEDARLGSLFD
ncbi:hypothetical protein BST61_g10772 [Cercospora zeina]